MGIDAGEGSYYRSHGKEGSSPPGPLGQVSMAEGVNRGGWPALDGTLTESGHGSVSSDTELLIQHILGVPEPTTTSFSHERVDDGDEASTVASTPKRRRAVLV
jgi:hypothetical protein